MTLFIKHEGVLPKSLPIYIFLNRLFWIFLVLEYGARGTPETLKRKNTGKYRLRSKVTLGNTIK